MGVGPGAQYIASCGDAEVLAQSFFLKKEERKTLETLQTRVSQERQTDGSVRHQASPPRVHFVFSPFIPVTRIQAGN